MIGHWCDTCGTEWDDNGPVYAQEIARLTEQRDALVAALRAQSCDRCGNLGVMVDRDDTPCRGCEFAVRAIEKARTK